VHDGFVSVEDMGGGLSGARRKSSPMLKSSLFDAKQNQLLHVNLITVTSSSPSPSSAPVSVGRSSSFKIYRSSSPDQLSPNDARSTTTSGSKSLPTTPVERVASTEDREVFPPSVMEYPRATSTRKKRTSWDEVMDIVDTAGDSPPSEATSSTPSAWMTSRRTTTATVHLQQAQPQQSKNNRRRKSTGSEEDDSGTTRGALSDETPAIIGVTGTSSSEDPWIENRPQKQSKSGPSSWRRLTTTDHVAALAAVIGYGIDRSPVSPVSPVSPPVNASLATGSKSVSPPFEGSVSPSGFRSSGVDSGDAATSAYKQRKRFSVYSHQQRHSAMVSASTDAAAALSNSPLDLAGVLGKIRHVHHDSIMIILISFHSCIKCI